MNHFYSIYIYIYTFYTQVKTCMSIGDSHKDHYVGPITCMESMVKDVHLQIDLASHQAAILVLLVTGNGLLNYL